MNNIFGLLLLILFGGAGLISIFVIVNLLLPVPVARTRAALETSLGRSLLLGLVNDLFAFVLVAGLLWLAQQVGGGVVAGILGLLALLVLLIVGLLSLLGLAALSNVLGMRIGQSGINSVTRGSVLLLLSGLTPYLGWFIVTPLIVWTALGAAIQAVVQKKTISAS